MTPDGEEGRDSRTDRRSGAPRGGALLGGALAVPVLAAVVLGAGAARPPATSDGVWTTPLQVVLGLAALGGLVVLVFVLRGMEVDAVRPGRPRGRTRAVVLFALLLVAIVVVPQLDLAPPGPDAGAFSFGPSSGGTASADPLPTSPTAVVAGLAALALAVAGATVLLRGGRRGPSPDRDQPVADPSPPSSTGTPSLDGAPDQVVLAAYAAARAEAVHHLGAGEHDPPGRLLRRADGTPLAGPLRVLTRLHLPVRYGRRAATGADAADAVAALEQLRATMTSARGGG